MEGVLDKTAQYHAEVNRYFRHNAVRIIIDNAMFFIVGLGLSQYTILPLYLSKLTNSKILIGLIPTVVIAGFALPQIFVARFLKNRPRRKTFLVLAATIQRTTILAFLILTLVQHSLSPVVTIVLFFIVLAAQNFMTGCWNPLYVDFVGHALPRSRGTVLGISYLIGGVISITGGGLITYLLKTLPYPKAISASAAIAFVASLISLAAISTWHETVPPQIEKALIQAHPDGNILHKVKLNKNFQKYLLWRGVIIGIEMALPFLTLSALDHLKVADAQVGIFAIILTLSQTVMYMFWGWYGDRVGYFKILLIATIFGCAGAILAAHATSLGLFYMVFVCAGAMLSGQQVANMNLIFEFSESDEIPTYAAIAQLLLSPISGLMPILGGVLISFFGYGPLFWVAGLFGFGGTLGMFLKVKNPRKEPAAIK